MEVLAQKREVQVLWGQITAILGLQPSQYVFSFPLKEPRLQESGEKGEDFNGKKQDAETMWAAPLGAQG